MIRITFVTPDGSEYQRLVHVVPRYRELVYLVIPGKRLGAPWKVYNVEHDIVSASIRDESPEAHLIRVKIQ